MGLQFSWIEANLLGFFLVDVRNSRGKFDEIKEKFVINPAPIASQSSLNVGGTRWTRDLPGNSPNFFTSRSKVKEQRSTWVFKEGNWPKIVGCRGSRGSGFAWSWERFLRATLPLRDWPRIGLNFAMNSVSYRPRFSSGSTTIDHDRGLIVRRLGVDLTAHPHENPVWPLWSWFRSNCSTIAARSRRDRGSIGPRSWSSSTCPRNRLITPQVNEWLRSPDRVVPDSDERPPSDGQRLRWWSWS